MPDDAPDQVRQRRDASRMSLRSRLDPNRERALGMALMAIFLLIVVAGVLVFELAF